MAPNIRHLAVDFLAGPQEVGDVGGECRDGMGDGGIYAFFFGYKEVGDTKVMEEENGE
jgi:hypothetical protein